MCEYDNLLFSFLFVLEVFRSGRELSLILCHFAMYMYDDYSITQLILHFLVRDSMHLILNLLSEALWGAAITLPSNVRGGKDSIRSISSVINSGPVPRRANSCKEDGHDNDSYSL